MTPIFAVLDTPIILVIVGVVVLLFGADRLPKLARSMGQAKKEFDSALHPGDPGAQPVQPSVTPTTTADAPAVRPQPAPPPAPPDDRPQSG